MNRSIERIASAIERDWSLSGRGGGEFPAIAARHLSNASDLDVGELIEDLSSARSLQPQRLLDQSFGQPQVTLYSGDIFQIEVLFWHSGTPAIHQHAFDGAFRLLAGRSAHCRYQFEPQRQIDRVTVGSLEITRFELLATGSTAQIPNGSDLIHSAFHIDSPSITLVARRGQDEVPELTYLPPGVAYDTAVRGTALHKKLQLLDTLAITSHPGYVHAVEAAIEAGDVYDGLAVLIRAGGHAIDDQTFANIADRLRARHADRDGIDTVVQAGFAECRRIRLVHSRHSMTDPHSRFFLAALLCFTDRDALIAALTDYAGTSRAAHDLIACSIGQLFGGNRDREILAQAAASVKLAGRPATSFVETVATMRTGDLTEKEEEALIRFYRQLSEHWLLSPLFDDSKGTTGVTS